MPADAELPKVCLGCAKTGVKRKARDHVMVPTWLVVIGLFTIGLVGLYLIRRSRRVSVRYALCEPCGQRAMNVEHTLEGISVASIIVGVMVLTALLNGAPVTAAAVALLGWGLLYAAYRRFVHDRRLWVVAATPRLQLQGVHPGAAEVVIEALRLDEDL